VHEREAIDSVEQQENLDQEAIGEIEFDLSLGHKQPSGSVGSSNINQAHLGPSVTRSLDISLRAVLNSLLSWASQQPTPLRLRLS